MTDKQMDDRTRCLTLTATSLCKQYDGSAMIMLLIDHDGRVTISGYSAEEVDLCKLLRAIAEKIELRQEKYGFTAVLPKGHDPENITTAGDCPVCHSKVFGPLKRPPIADHYAAVCQCGSFLLPHWDSTDTLCGLTLMTEQQVAALPDEVRNTLVRLRRHKKFTGVAH